MSESLWDFRHPIQSTFVRSTRVHFMPPHAKTLSIDGRGKSHSERIVSKLFSTLVQLQQVKQSLWPRRSFRRLPRETNLLFNPDVSTGTSAEALLLTISVPFSFATRRTRMKCQSSTSLSLSPNRWSVDQMLVCSTRDDVSEQQQEQLSYFLFDRADSVQLSYQGESSLAMTPLRHSFKEEFGPRTSASVFACRETLPSILSATVKNLCSYRVQYYYRELTSDDLRYGHSYFRDRSIAEEKTYWRCNLLKITWRRFHEHIADRENNTQRTNRSSIISICSSMTGSLRSS